MRKKCTYNQDKIYLPMNCSVSFQKRRTKNVLFSLFSSVHTMTFLKCAGKSSVFKNYRFRNQPAKNVPFSFAREAREACTSHFLPLSKGDCIVRAQSKKASKGPRLSINVFS